MPSQDDLEALGTIRVDIYRVVWRGIIENPFHKGGLGQLDGDHAVHEKAKKADLPPKKIPVFFIDEAHKL